jgi:hypothetical protein
MDAQGDTEEEYAASEYGQSFRAEAELIKSEFSSEWIIMVWERADQGGPSGVMMLSGPSDNWRIDIDMVDIGAWRASVHDVRKEQGEIRDEIWEASGIDAARSGVAHIEWQMS